MVSAEYQNEYDHSTNRDFNPALLKYKASVLPTRPRLSVYISWTIKRYYGKKEKFATRFSRCIFV